MAESERSTARAEHWSDEQITRLVRQHQRALAAYLAAIGCPAGQIADVLQDGFLALLRSGFEERSSGATAAYLRRIVKNGYLKSTQRAPSTAALSEIDLAWQAYERDDGGASYLDALRECLAGLAAATRRVLELRYGEGLSRGEVAHRTQLSEGGVKSALLRGKQRLRQCIERRLG